MNPIPGYEGYAISDDLNVASLRGSRGSFRKFLVPFLNKDGYPSVRVSIGGRRKEVTIHKLVALTLLPPKPDECNQIRHLDGTRTNYHPSNLTWGTNLENAEDMVRHGRSLVGTKHHKAKFTDDDIRNIRAAFDSFAFTYDEMAEMFKCTRANIYYIGFRLTWRHVPDAA